MTWTFWPGTVVGFLAGLLVGVVVVLVTMWVKKTARATKRAAGLAGSGVRVLGVVVLLIFAIGGVWARWS